MQIEIKIRGPLASGKSTIVRKLARFFVAEGFHVKVNDAGNRAIHGLPAAESKASISVQQDW